MSLHHESSSLSQAMTELLFLSLLWAEFPFAGISLRGVLQRALCVSSSLLHSIFGICPCGVGILPFQCWVIVHCRDGLQVLSSPLDGHLLFQHLAVMNEAVDHIHVQVFVFV